MSQGDARRGSDKMASYLALYSRSLNPPIDRSRTPLTRPSSFNSCHQTSRKAQLFERCQAMERKMSSNTIQLGRALALGWRESQKFDQYVKRTRLNDVSAYAFGGTEAFGKVSVSMMSFLIACLLSVSPTLSLSVSPRLSPLCIKKSC
jgi:hypothetical protein